VAKPVRVVHQAPTQTIGYHPLLLSEAADHFDDTDRKSDFGSRRRFHITTEIPEFTCIRTTSLLNGSALHCRLFDGDTESMWLLSYNVLNRDIRDYLVVRGGAMAGDQTDHWLTVEQVAERLAVNPETVRRWIRSGALPVLQLGGPRTGYRINELDLEAFISERYGPVGKVTA